MEVRVLVTEEDKKVLWKAFIKRILMGLMDREPKYIVSLLFGTNIFNQIFVQCQQLKKEKVWRSG